MSAEENSKAPEPESDEAMKSNSDNAVNGESGSDSGDDLSDLDLGREKTSAEVAAGPEFVHLDLQLELDKAQALANENWERVLRMQADMENQRKRSQKDIENARKFALEAIVNDLLPVRDSLEMGLAAAMEQDADPAKIIEGSDLTLKMLSQAFEKYNIIEINPVDQKFDPEFHQAMSMQDVPGMEPNTVTGVLQKGYTLNDRLVRPALVMVAK